MLLQPPPTHIHTRARARSHLNHLTPNTEGALQNLTFMFSQDRYIMRPWTVPLRGSFCFTM